MLTVDEQLIRSDGKEGHRHLERLKVMYPQTIPSIHSLAVKNRLVSCE
jgi:hypothetical protein